MHPTHRSATRLAIALAFSLPAIALPAISEDGLHLPTRKAGLWELKTTMDEGLGPREQSLKMCIDAEMERNTATASIREHQENCTKYEIRKDGGKTTIDSDCTYSGATVTSHTEMTGDFEKSFDIKIASTTVPPNMGAQSTPIKRTIDQAGSYVGESCDGLQPGEAMGADGNKVMVQ